MRWRRDLPNAVLILSVVGVVAWWTGYARLETVTGLPRAAVGVAAGGAPLPDDPGALRELARAASPCREGLAAWWKLAELDENDLEAWRSIATCGQQDRIDEVLARTTRAFEESELLALVPAALDTLHVRELVPILNDVQRRPEKGVADYVFIARSLQRLGDPRGAVGAFQQALTLDPENDEVRLELGQALLAEGRVGEAREAFRSALGDGGLPVRLSHVYALAVGWPWLFFLAVGAMVGGSAALSMNRVGFARFVGRVADLPADVVRTLLVGAAAMTLALLGTRFYYTADRLAFGWMALLSAVAAAWLVLSPTRRPVSRALSAVSGFVGSVAAGQVWRRLARLSAAQQLAVLGLTVFGVVFGLPLVPSIELRLFGLFLGGMLLFSTVGSLLLRMLEQLGSFRAALRWLAVAGTVPFLLFFLMVEWGDVLVELRDLGHLGSHTRNRLAAYGVVWTAGLGFAVLLAGILSRSVVVPLGRILEAVRRVRAGDFLARTGVSRRDEIGTLADAVDEMAAGLAEREEIKRTFRRYVDATVAERLIAGDQTMLVPRQVHATVLFSDVRGFTSASEQLSPGEVVALLNDYFARMAPIVARYGGVVDKFLGDGLLAVWDVPEPLQTGPHAGVPGERLAVEAALEMRRALADYNASLVGRGLAPITIGIGINAGELVAGPLGSPDRLEYTVVGDTVNTAQRVEGVARGDNPLLVTGAVADVVRPFVELSAIEPVMVKGKREPLSLWRVDGPRVPVAG